MNAARKYLNMNEEKNLGGILFASGLGGMSGAQAKAAVITGAICVIAECNPFAAKKRHQQGWLNEIYHNLDELSKAITDAKNKREAVSIKFNAGNIVDLLDLLLQKELLLI